MLGRRGLIATCCALGLLVSPGCGDDPAGPLPVDDPNEPLPEDHGLDASRLPLVEDFEPTSAVPGNRIALHIRGENFDVGSRVDLLLSGNSVAEVQTLSTQFVTSEELLADISIGIHAPVGDYQVQVTTSGGKRGIPIENFAVTADSTDTATDSIPSDSIPAIELVAGIEIVSGNNQRTKANVRLAEPLVVRVTDEQGKGVANVAVRWSATPGLWCSGCPGLVLGDGWISILTDRNGLAEVRFTPPSVGASTITASVAGLSSSPVTFTADATGLVIWLGSSRDWGFYPYPETVTVPVGTTIEWWSGVSYSITSTSVPPGGESFTSGMLGSTEGFQFVPNVAGSWEFTAREYDDGVANGGAQGSGIIYVQ